MINHLDLIILTKSYRSASIIHQMRGLSLYGQTQQTTPGATNIKFCEGRQYPASEQQALI